MPKHVSILTPLIALVASLCACCSARAEPMHDDDAITQARAWRGIDAVSITLKNGIEVVHLNPPEGAEPEERSDEIWVSLFLAGGELLESDSTRGITRAVAGVFGRDAILKTLTDIPSDTSDASSRVAQDARRLFERDDVRIGCAVISGGLLIRVRATDVDLEAVFFALRSLLEHPAVPVHEVSQWKSRVSEHLVTTDPANEAWRFARQQLAGVPDPATIPFSHMHVEAIADSSDHGARQVSEWIKITARAAPLTVVAIGVPDRASVIDAAIQSFGSLPNRDEDTGRRLDAMRAAPPKSGAINVARDLADSDRDVSIVGYRGAEASEPTRMRALTVASRAIEQLIEDGGFADGYGAIRVISRPSLVLRGQGFFGLEITAEKGRGTKATMFWQQALDGILVEGLTADQVTEAVSATAASAAELMTDGSYWSWVAPGASFRGFDVDRLGQADAAYRRLTTEHVNAVLRDLRTSSDPVRIEIRGVPSKEDPASKEQTIPVPQRQR